MPTILYEDNHLLLLNKPAGWLVQGDATGDATLLDWGKNYLKDRYAKPGAVFLHPVHRLDRPVSGAVLLARTDKALGRLNIQFQKREVEKEYWALCLRRPGNPKGELRHYLLKDESRNIVRIVNRAGAEAKEAVLQYELIKPVNDFYLLRVLPLTGRPHQIRVQLASIGCIILGDLKYGAPAPLPDASIALHSRRLEFLHPVKREPLQVQAPVPGKSWWRGAEEE